jgi:hypothetical protein
MGKDQWKEIFQVNSSKTLSVILVTVEGLYCLDPAVKLKFHKASLHVGVGIIKPVLLEHAAIFTSACAF